MSPSADKEDPGVIKLLQTDYGLQAASQSTCKWM